MLITEEQLIESRKLTPFILVEWFHKIKTKIPTQSQYWLLEKQDEYFRSAFQYVLVNSGKHYVGGYTVDGVPNVFECTLDFLCANRAHSNSYDKRIEDWANLLKKGQENNFETWEQVRYKWKGK